MYVLADLQWFEKIALCTFIMAFLLIVQFIPLIYSMKNHTECTDDIIVNKNTENVENYLLKNYYRIKNSGKYSQILLFSFGADDEQEKICQIFSRFKSINYIKIQ